MITRIPSTSRDNNFIKNNHQRKLQLGEPRLIVGIALATVYRHDNISWCFADDSDLRIRSHL